MGWLGFSRARVGLLAGALCLLLGGVAWAAGSHARPRRLSAPTVGVGSAAAGSRSARALRGSWIKTRGVVRSQAPVTAGAELPWLRKADSRTFVAGSGRLVTRIYPFAINYRTGKHEFSAINPDLVATGAGYRQAANGLGITLPQSASGGVHVGTGASALSFGLAGAFGRGVVSGAVERFADAGSGIELAYAS